MRTNEGEFNVVATIRVFQNSMHNHETFTNTPPMNWCAEKEKVQEKIQMGRRQRWHFFFLGEAAR